MNASVVFGITAAVVVAAACIDVYMRRIPNWLSIPFLATGLLLRLLSGGVPAFVVGLKGVGLGLLLFGWAWVLKGMGMGDVKLAAAIAGWIGPSQFMLAFAVTGITGGALAVVYSLRSNTLIDSVENTRDLLAHFASGHLHPHKTLCLGNSRALTIPYAPAIAVGTLFSFLAQ